MESRIPDNVARFLALHIRSLEQLEILMLVWSHPEQDWTAESVYNIVRSSRSSVGERLEELHGQGLLSLNRSSTPISYRFAPNPPELVEIVAALAHEYKERRVKVVEIIYAPRTEPLKGFADAFKLRKEP
jgi:hypothetical protein